MKNIAPLMRKKWLLAVIAAAVVGSGAYAFAATLGVNSNSLGAGDAVVGSCIGTGAQAAKATYSTAYDSANAIASHTTDGSFLVDGVTVTIPAANTCKTGDVIQVVFTGTNALATTPATLSYTLTGSTDTPTATVDGVFTITPGSTIVPAADVTGLHLAESGPTS